MKKKIRRTFLLSVITILVLTSCTTLIRQNNTLYNYYLDIADTAYMNRDYTSAYDIYKIIDEKVKINEGIKIYKYAYSATLTHQDDIIQYQLYQRAYELIKNNSIYQTYTDNCLSWIKTYNSEKEHSITPGKAENGDIKGNDNDGDGRRENVYVRGYYRKDGTYVRSHYRASPRRK